MHFLYNLLNIMTPPLNFILGGGGGGGNPHDFLLMDGTDFMLMDGTNFLLMGT